ncbi:hypothetical protein KSP40_PGU001151 [Platanthera guangdongensis]|uniref:Uncharacterized protein n=1 Tax=Platanthera guangdongensis TaxID=2320717 RepID=A0ABR2LLL8_9ASPA
MVGEHRKQCSERNMNSYILGKIVGTLEALKIDSNWRLEARYSWRMAMKVLPVVTPSGIVDRNREVGTCTMPFRESFPCSRKVVSKTISSVNLCNLGGLANRSGRLVWRTRGLVLAVCLSGRSDCVTARVMEFVKAYGARVV